MTTNRMLAGEVVVFAGRLQTVGKREAADLVRRLGGLVETEPSERTTLVVVGLDRRAPGRDEQADAELQRLLGRVDRLHETTPDRPRRIDEDAFCALVGRPGPALLRAQWYPLTTLRKLYPNIRDDQLRYVEKFGLLRSVVRTPGEVWYGFADLAVVKQLSADLARGASFRAVVRALTAAEQGQLALDFNQPVPSAAGSGTLVETVPKVVAMPRSGHGPTAVNMRLTSRVELSPAEQRFLSAEHADLELAELDAAMTGYRQALMLDPGLVPAMVNLGNLHYAIDQLAEAQAFYVQAAVVDPECFEAHFNLGNIHHDLGRFRQAAMCYEEALRLNAGYADAHFYLAVSLEKMGESPAARPHWRRYLELAPDGEWVDLAREFAEQ